MTHSEPNEHSLRSIRHLLHPQECLRPCLCACPHSPLPFERVFRRQTASMTEWSPSCGECGFLRCLGISVKQGERRLWHGGAASHSVFWNQINGGSTNLHHGVRLVYTGMKTEKQTWKLPYHFLILPLHASCVSVWVVYGAHTHTQTETQTYTHTAPPIGCKLFCSRDTLTGVHFWLWTVVWCRSQP